MKKVTVSLIAGIIVVFLIIVLNSLCAGCVYAQQNSPARLGMASKSAVWKS